MFQLSQRSKSRLVGVDPRIPEIIDLALQITKVDFGIPHYGGVRKPAEQYHLFQQGRSKADGYIKKSKHQSGKAFDVFAYVDGDASWEKEHLAQVAAAILQAAMMLGHKLMWGGLFKGWFDGPHFELIEEEQNENNTTTV